MKNTTLFKLFLILIIAGLVYLKFISDQAPQPATDSNTPQISDFNTPPPTNLVQFTTPYFTLSHDSLATPSTSTPLPDSQEWNIAYMGAKQRALGDTPTELFDGYALTLTRFEVIGSDPALVQAQADRRVVVDACGDDSATSISGGLLGDFETLTFYGGCLGEATYHYFMVDENLYRLTYMVVGEDSDITNYQAIINSMLKSLTFR